MTNHLERAEIELVQAHYADAIPAALEREPDILRRSP
jgi:hypothetical protein